MNKFHPLITVIVPVYNVEQQLERCLNSILDQTYNKYELIIINDGSTDSSGCICDEYKKKDNRVKVFHKQNEGASSARNAGIEKANGEYICFVDSDDYVDNRYLTAFLVDSLIKDKYTLVVQDLQFENGDSISKYSNFIEGNYSGKDFSKLFSLNEIDRRGGPVSKLYNKEIITTNNLKFHLNIHAGEDLLFMISYLSLIKNVFLSADVNYHAVSTPGSLSKRYNSFESEFLTFQLLQDSYTKLDSIHTLDGDAKQSIRRNSLSFHFIRVITTIYRPQNRKKRKERLKILKELYSKENITLFELRIRKGIKINKVGFYFFCKKMFSLFDLYYFLIYSLRYSFNNHWQKYLKWKSKRYYID